MIALTCVEKVASENFLHDTSLQTPHLLFLGTFRKLIVLERHHIEKADEQIVCILLLEASKAGVALADPCKELGRVVGVA